MIPFFCKTRDFKGRNVAYFCPECAIKYFPERSKACSSGSQKSCDICGRYSISAFSVATKKFFNWIKDYNWFDFMKQKTIAYLCWDCKRRYFSDLKLDFDEASGQSCTVCGCHPPKLVEITKESFIVRMGESGRKAPTSE